jgi:hypothetical protein
MKLKPAYLYPTASEIKSTLPIQVLTCIGLAWDTKSEEILRNLR